MKIILAIDDSKYSQLATDAVVKGVWPSGSQIKVLASVVAITPPNAEIWVDAGHSLETAQSKLSEQAKKTARTIACRLRDLGFNAEPSVLHGDPRAVIVDAAREWDADLIVMGAPAQKGVARFFLGGVAEAVMDHAPCPVEVVREDCKPETPAGPDSTRASMTAMFVTISVIGLMIMLGY